MFAHVPCTARQCVLLLQCLACVSGQMGVLAVLLGVLYLGATCMLHVVCYRDPYFLPPRQNTL